MYTEGIPILIEKQDKELIQIRAENEAIEQDYSMLTRQKTVCARILRKNEGCRSTACKLATPPTPVNPRLASKSPSPAGNNEQTTEIGRLEVDFRILPNLSSSNITLLLDQVLVGQDVKIFNMKGACVYTGIIDSSNKEIDIQSFAKRSYVVLCQNINLILKILLCIKT